MRLGWLACVSAELAIVLAMSGQVQATDDPLRMHRWKHRVLVISAPTPDDPSARAQRISLASQASGLRERNLVTVEVVGDGPDQRRLRRHLGLPDDAFRAVLVGKDGATKLVAVEPIPTGRLFDTIDAMPMRREEIRR